jgi:hypothetical protein
MSSLSMNKVRGRALNANAQNTNNYSMWMEPLSHGDYPLTHITNPTANAVVTSNGVKNVAIAQPGLLYNNVRLDVSGSVNPTRWTTGQTVNTMFLMPGDTSFNQINTNISSGTVSSYIYTPHSNHSKIIVEYSALYNVGGNTSSPGNVTDAFQSEITVTDIVDPIAKRQQYFRTGDGASNRSSTLFPIAGAYNNSALTPVEFNIILSRIAGDDTIQFYSAYFDACMKITEISL